MFDKEISNRNAVTEAPRIARDRPRIKSSLGSWRGALIVLVVAHVLMAVTLSGSQDKALDPVRTSSVTVMLHVFSGVPDPSWRLSRKQIVELADRIDWLQPVSMDEPWEQPSKLGYRGFTIIVKQRRASAKELFVYDNVMDLGKLGGKRKGSDNSLEKWLLETAGKAITRHARVTAQNELEALSKNATAQATASVRVTLHIFSGVPDPSWTLTPEQARLLSEKLQALKVDNANSRWEMPSRLGYRGFTLAIKPEDGPASEFYLYDNIIQLDKSRGRRVDSDHALESWVLETAGSALEPDIRTLAEKGLAELLSRKAGR